MAEVMSDRADERIDGLDTVPQRGPFHVAKQLAAAPDEVGHVFAGGGAGLQLDVPEPVEFVGHVGKLDLALLHLREESQIVGRDLGQTILGGGLLGRVLGHGSPLSEACDRDAPR